MTSGRASQRIPVWGLAVALLILGALPPVLRYLVFWPQDQWQVDVEVYRQAALSLLAGTDIYATLTEPPQLLPFTYPPFAAMVLLPFAFVPPQVGVAFMVLLSMAVAWWISTLIVDYANARGRQLPLQDKLGRTTTIALLTALRNRHETLEERSYRKTATARAARKLETKLNSNAKI